MTASFRMGPDMGRLLGEAWNKPVVGVNDAQVVREMSHDEAVAYMGHVAPGDLLVLGKRNNGYALRALNELERTLPGQFNKNTVYASIKDRGESGEYSDDTANFTTFDSAKGLERPVTFVYDMDPEYYNMRMRLALTDPEVIRNVFLVAASRGKGEIVFVHNVENSGTAKVATQLAMADSFADAQQIASRHDVDFPVSYTHLDVYKRQGHAFGRHAEGRGLLLDDVDVLGLFDLEAELHQADATLFDDDRVMVPLVPALVVDLAVLVEGFVEAHRVRVVTACLFEVGHSHVGVAHAHDTHAKTPLS